MRRKVLILDDDRNSRHFQELFTRLGCEAFTASPALGLGGAMASCRPDVVMVDVGFSDIHSEQRGFEVVRELKRNNSETTVVLMTDHGNPVLVDRAFRVGADYYAEKPITAEIARRFIT